jgi:predicted amidohydrolase YtcJ
VLAFVNGTIRPGPSFSSTEPALLVYNGAIAGLGRSALLRAAEPETYVIDLAGACVLPGLIDTHFHAMATGIGLLAVDLSDARSVDEVLAQLRDAQSAGDSSEWLLGRGLDESQLAEQRVPTLAELDAVAPQRPLFVDDRGLHYALVNSLAMTRLDPTETALVPHVALRSGGARLQERAAGLARRALASQLEPAVRRDALRRAARYAVSLGLTTIHAVEGGELFSDDDIELLHAVRASLPLNVVQYWSTDDVGAVARSGLSRMGGDILCDGALGSRTAALLDDYADQPGERGQLLRDASTVQQLVEAADRAGIQVGVHAIGDRAVREALAGMQAALGGRPNTLRHRIDHFGVVWPRDLELAAKLDIAIATQPSFAAMRGRPGGVYEQRLGAERLRRAYPLGDFARAGLRVAGGSDSPVGPAAPLFGLQAAVLPPQADQALDLNTALQWYTVDAAWLGGEERLRGTLELGKAADLVVFAQDPFSVPAASLADIPVLATYVAGVEVYSRAPRDLKAGVPNTSGLATWAGREPER